MTASESVFDGPSGHVQWAASLVAALVDGDEPLLAQLMAADGDADSEARMLALGSLCLIVLRMWEAGGGPLPEQTLRVIDAFMLGGGIDLDLLAFIDLAGGGS